MRILVNIDVPELAPAIDFYRAALGLELVRIIDGDVAELSGAGVPVFLLEKSAGSSPAAAVPERRYGRHWTPVHMDFVVEDLAQACERALRAGAVQESELVEWMGSRCITFSDPFGHGFCLIEFTGESYRDA